MDSVRWKTSSLRQRRVTRYCTGALAVILFLHLLWGSYDTRSKAAKIQHDFGKDVLVATAQEDRLDAVKQEFIHAWTGYRTYAWMSDSLRPISGGGQEQFCGWAATLVDSLDTLYIMGFHDEFAMAVNATLTIDFWGSMKTCDINFFESTIRYLGGFLAAYDLSLDERLKPKIAEIGEILYMAFNTTTGMPCSHCKLDRNDAEGPLVPDVDVPLADALSFYPEFTRLAQITGDEKFIAKVLEISAVAQQTQNMSSIPGLWPERLDATNIWGPDSHFASSSDRFSLGALSDSAYEYLVKTHLILGGTESRFAEMWSSAVSAIKETMLFRAYIPQWNETDALFAGIVTKSEVNSAAVMEARTEHLACFAGGMFAMSSRLFGVPEDMEIGKALADSCVWAYTNAPYGIMPETITLLPCPQQGAANGTSTNTTIQQQCAWNETVWSEAYYLRNPYYPPGFVSSLDTVYRLRPEAIESVFIMWRTTGDSYWREVGWQMFQSIIKQTRAPHGHAMLINIMDTFRYGNTGNNAEQPLQEDLKAQQMDEMESFWLAETLKYFYLLFSDPNLISLDDFVLNTEAHPLRLVDGARALAPHQTH